MCFNCFNIVLTVPAHSDAKAWCSWVAQAMAEENMSVHIVPFLVVPPAPVCSPVARKGLSSLRKLLERPYVLIILDTSTQQT